MPVTLPHETRKHALTSLKRFWNESLDAEVSDLQAMALLDFFLKEIGPSVYNAGVAEAQTYLRDRLEDLESTCCEPEFTYWPKSASVRRK
ncbi:MAG: DUF2164 domain-containing protein [Gemmatimonadota bacterium]|nr:DUF2164 domain-containing protein [Gemmatimonadota bacterium]MDH5282938.1 DUF2164 domain-containing protein [Gemmatimonadota bacterium]